MSNTPSPVVPRSHDWNDQDKCKVCGDRDWYAEAYCSGPPIESLRANGITEEELAESTNAHREAAELAKQQ